MPPGGARAKQGQTRPRDGSLHGTVGSTSPLVSRARHKAPTWPAVLLGLGPPDCPAPGVVTAAVSNWGRQHSERLTLQNLSLLPVHLGLVATLFLSFCTGKVVINVFS